MKFKLVENYNVRKSIIQEYIYDAIQELGNASLEEYIQWFSALDNFDHEVRQAIKDVYIEAIDCGKIKRPKTMITSELTTYLESNADLIDKDVDELINNCPDHLKHELTLVLDKLDDSLNEELLTEAKLYRLDFDYLSTDSDKVNSDYIYLYGKNKETTNELVSRIYKQDSHESYAKHWQQFFNDVSGLTFRSSKIVPVATVLSDADHLFTLTYSPWRTSSRKAAAQDSALQAFINKEHALNNTDKSFLHHPDGNELVEDPQLNSYILYNELKDGRFYPLVIHNMLHSSAVDPRKIHDSGILSNPIIVYDPSVKSYVCRHLKIEVI